MGLRPDRAVIVYGNLIRRIYKHTPMIIGGIEASLRRFAHYDYWSDSLKRSVLLDSGADIDALMQGAADAREAYSSENLDENEAYQYAALRNILYRKGKVTEILVNYEPGMQYFNEWWKQLYGESEGKDLKGIYPSSAN